MNGSLMTAEQSNRAKSWQDTKETTEGGGGGGGGEGGGGAGRGNTGRGETLLISPG